MCKLHFESRCILRGFVHVINGKKERIPRGNPVLTDDAVSTILPNRPSYLSRNMLKPRPRRRRIISSPLLPLKRGCHIKVANANVHQTLFSLVTKAMLLQKVFCVLSSKCQTCLDLLIMKKPCKPFGLARLTTPITEDFYIHQQH